MGVCSERTKGTKIMESSSESLTMNMKPRLNMQVAAACWTLRQCGKQSCRSTPRDSKPLSRKEKGPQRPVIGGLLGKDCGTTWEGGRTWSSAGRSWFRWGGRPLPAPGSEQDNGSWALTPCLPPSPPRRVQSCFEMAGRVRAVLSSRKTVAQTESLPSAVWTRRLLYLAQQV